MAWFFRVIELDSGHWACRHGRLEYDTHDEVHQAIEHIAALAAGRRPAELMLHLLDGTVHHLGAV